jgi:non-ribosomal peptide synthetase component F
LSGRRSSGGSFEDTSLTYKELNARANQLANYPEDWASAGILVGICMQRSLEMVVGIFGMLKAGALMCR